MRNVDQIKVFAIVLVIICAALCLKPSFESYQASKSNNDTNDSATMVEAENSNSEDVEPTMQAPDQTPQDKLNYTSFINTQLNSNGTATITVNPPTAYSGKTKAEIYAIRKSYVKRFFNLPNYEPNESIFGQIQDGKPWISTYAAFCNFDDMSKKTGGTSEESIFMNNPLGLIMVEMPYYNYSAPATCSPSAYLIPTKFVVDKDKITAYYNLSAYQKNLKPEALQYTIYVLKPINAKDLGYEWGYAEPRKAGFNGENAIDEAPYQFQDFIHLGGSCGVEGGCNNGSPFQQQLTMFVRSFPAEIYFKLWKQAPHSQSSTPDLIYKIVLN